jgi:hypothetical protein
MKFQDKWIIETLLIEAQYAVHGRAIALVCGLCEPEDLIRIAYPPNLKELDMLSLAKRLTKKELGVMIDGELSDAEISAIRSTNVGENKTKQEALRKVFVETFSALMFHWFNTFDGTSDPRLVKATALCASWPGATISALSPEEEKLSKLPKSTEYELQKTFSNAYQDFNQLVSAEPYAPLEVEKFDNDETIIRTLILEAYCEIEIQSRQAIEMLKKPDSVQLVYPLDETNTHQLSEPEKQAVRSLGLEDELLRATLQKAIADSCYTVVSNWLKSFDWTSTPLNQREGMVWHGAKITASGERYPDMLHDAFYELWHEYIRLTSQPPQRPF